MWAADVRSQEGRTESWSPYLLRSSNTTPFDQPNPSCSGTNQNDHMITYRLKIWYNDVHLLKSLLVNFQIFCLYYQVLHILHLVSYILILELPVLDNENMMYKSGRYYAFRNITVFFINNKWIRNNGSCDVMFVPYLYKVFTSTPTPARCCGRILQYKIICSIKFKQWNIIINRFRTDSIPVLCKPMAF